MIGETAVVGKHFYECLTYLPEDQEVYLELSFL